MEARPLLRIVMLFALGASGGLLAPAAHAADPVSEATQVFRNLEAELVVTGMTFVGSRDGRSEFVVRAERAIYRPETRRAELEEVRVTSTEDGGSLEVRCDRGELDVDTNDLVAEGNVTGTTVDGRRYSAPWVRYEHERGLLYTDAPVILEGDTGRLSGDGFRYYVQEERFRLLGNVRVLSQ